VTSVANSAGPIVPFSSVSLSLPKSQEVYAARDRDAGLRAAAENALREASAVAALAEASERRAQAQAFAHPPLSRHQAPVEESLPEASRAPSHALLFAVGGLSKASTPLDSAEGLHMAEKAWRPLPRLSCARAYCAAAAAGPAGRQGDCTLYVTGGSGGAAPLDSCEALPPGEGAAWRRVARMATRRVWHSAAALGERVYVAGGYDGTRYLSCCEVLDMAQDAPRGMWRTLSPLGRGRSTLGLASLSGLLYAVGGFCAPNYLATVEAYDPQADAWWSCPPLREPRRELGVAALQQHGMIIACGGYDGERYVAACEGFDPRANAWRPLAPLKRPRQLLGLAAAGGLAYAVGGFDGRSAGGWVEAYEPRMDAWREAPSLSGGPRMGHGLAAVLAG